MATHQIPITGFGLVPDSGDGAYIAPLTAGMANDQFQTLAIFLPNSGNRDMIHGSFVVPENYVGTPALVVLWAPSSTNTGGVVFEFDYISRQAGESIDPSASWDQQATGTDTPPGTIGQLAEHASFSLGSNFAAGDTVLFQFGRDSGDGSDSFAGIAMVVGLLFSYADA